MKKTLTIVIALLIAFLIGGLIWFFFFRDNTDPNTGTGDEVQQFFPTENNGSIDPFNAISEDGTPVDDINIQNEGDRAEIPKLRLLSRDPVAGMIAFETIATTSDTFINDLGAEAAPTTTEIVFRYMERGTGHIYETKENSLTKQRISNTTIPKVYNALFNTDGTKLLLRYLDLNNETIKTFASAIVPNQDSAADVIEFTIEGRFLPDNIGDLSYSTEGNKVLYLKNIPGTEDTGMYIADLIEESISLIYQTQISQWISQWLNDTTVAITTRAHSKVSGYSFLVDTENKQLAKVIEAEKGLTTTYNIDATRMLYSVADGRSIKTYIYSVPEKTSIPINIKTIPDKCAWSPVEQNIIYCGAPNIITRADYPEDWYQGEVTFKDNIWKIDTDTFRVENIYRDRSETDESFDIIKPQISPDGRYLMFVNKKDLSLWSLDINPSLLK